MLDGILFLNWTLSQFHPETEKNNPVNPVNPVEYVFFGTFVIPFYLQFSVVNTSFLAARGEA